LAGLVQEGKWPGSLLANGPGGLASTFDAPAVL